MELKLLFLESCLTIFISGIQAINGKEFCPEIARIEEFSESTISCATNDKEITQAYWYRGSVSHTSPILQLKDGQRGGREQGKGHFEIADNGAMIIRNVLREHEAVYTFIVFYEDNTFEDKNVTIYVTSTPDTPCPHIEGCSLCEECNLRINENGTITCSLKNSRPKMKIEWVVEHTQDGNFTAYPPTFTNDNTADTWNVSVELSYILYPCHVVVIHCVAHDDHGLLKHPSSTIRLQSDICKEATYDKAYTLYIGIALVSTILVLVVVCVCVCYKHKCRGSQANHKSMSFQQHAPSDARDDAKQKEKRLINALKEAYRPDCGLRPLPWGTQIPVIFSYADCQLIVENKHESSEALFTDEILKQKECVLIVGNSGCGKTSLAKSLIQNWIDEEENDSILLYIPSGDITEGSSIVDFLMKTSNTKSKVTITELHSVLAISNLWLLIDDIDNCTYSKVKQHQKVQANNGDEKDEYTKEKTDFEKGVSDEQSEENDETSFMMDEGLSEKRVHWQHGEAPKENPISGLTIKQLLEGQIKATHMKIQVWATASGIKNVPTLFSDQCLKVSIDKFSEEQVESYIKRMCFYYSNFVAHRDSLSQLKCTDMDFNHSTENECGICESLLSEYDEKLSEETKQTQNGDIVPTKRTKRNIVKYVIKQRNKDDSTTATVLEFFKGNNVFKDFNSTPSLMVMIVHILAVQNVSTIDLPFRKITSKGELIATIISGLEKRYLQNSLRVSSKLDIKLLENTLEQLAFEIAVEKANIFKDSDEFLMNLDYAVKIAIKIGLLQRSQTVASETNENHASSASAKIEFYHKSFKEYFAARYTVYRLKDEDSYKKAIKKFKESGKWGVLQYISHLSSP